MQAVKQALSLKNAEKAVIVLEGPVKLTGKTKDAVKVMKDLKIANKNVLAVAAEKTPEVLRSTNNISNLKLVKAQYLNVFDIMNADVIVFSEAGLKATSEWLKGDK